MSFVGTRPEVTKYVKKYTKEMRATLLLPAGIVAFVKHIKYSTYTALKKKADEMVKNRII